MYVRPQNYRYPEGVRLPKNYSGSTFREPLPEENPTTDSPEEILEEISAEQESSSSPQPDSNVGEDTAALLTQKSSPLSSLFGGKGIGSEELLLFALILLLSDSELGNDLIFFLILLFFIK